MPILEVNNLEIRYGDNILVKEINFTIEKKQWLSLVGESGSGKSITAFSVGRILPENLKMTVGNIILDGQDILKLDDEELRRMRGEQIAYVFQDYQGAFTPFIRTGIQMDEMIRNHCKLSGHERKQMIVDVLDKVGLNGKKHYYSYPFQLSGGQLQRAAIAQATLLKPKLLIADEPTTALDAISQKRVLDLIEMIKDETECAVLFITHNLRCVQQYSDEVVVMYKGSVVESGQKDEIFNKPKHRYTRNLFASVPPLSNPPKRLDILDYEFDLERGEPDEE